MSPKELASMISFDASTIINMLIIYKIAAKFLTDEELNAIMEEGQKVLTEQMSKLISNSHDKSKITQTITNTVSNIKTVILSMKTPQTTGQNPDATPC